MTFLIGVLVGAFLGWAVPQPQWAKDLWTKVVTWLKGLSSKK